MKNLRLRLQILLMAIALPLMMSAQDIRYVKVDGAGAKNGSSWANAYANIQDAINDLVNNNKTGEVWVAAGTYYPTETTESSSSPYYKSFKIPAGITVRGGFAGSETSASERQLLADKNFGTPATSDNFDASAAAKKGVYANKTILCGDIYKSKPASFTWNKSKQQYDATFYGNSYHVVWFAMNGFNSEGRAKPLSSPARLEGCIIEGGHAFTSDSNAPHPHVGYGGGIYMVANSYVNNCEVRHCDASRNGGGIYMDGGGIVERTYVHNCQALGLGTEFGLGGGVCENGASHNSKQNPVVMARSVVTNCVGRVGGGMALLADQTVGNNKYAVVANSTLVNNNTAQMEAGGVYTHKGGAVASMTIVRNKCNGTGIMHNDVVTGRSGGLYNQDAAYVANSVLWGNACAANSDVQYASSRSNLTDSEKTHFYCNAVSKMDDADWSGTTRMGVLSLDDNNDADTGAKGSKGYPLFFKPTPADSIGHMYDIDKWDILKNDNESTVTEKKAKWTNWQVSSESYLTYAGIATIDLDTDGFTPAPEESHDMQSSRFNARPTLGALVSQVADIAFAENVEYDGVKYAKGLFVDPSFIYAGDNTGHNGTNWTTPIRFLGNALDFAAANAGGDRVAIFVKEGTVDNTRTLGGSRIRTTSLDIPSNVTLIGSFDKSLKATYLNKRNVVKTPTVISAKLMEDYKYNVAHLIRIDNQHDIMIDGFKLTFANANSEELSNTDKNGAAITINNCHSHKIEVQATQGGSSEPVDVETLIRFRNIIVSNCFGDKGTVVYADNSNAHFENCIFHNNATATINNSGLIYGVNGSNLTFDHCDVLRNVGHASYLGGTTTNHWQNSIFYGNMDRKMADTNLDMGGGITYALAAFSGNTDQATGDHCMFDANSVSFAGNFGGGNVTTGGDTGNKWQYNLQYAFVDGTGQGYPRFINPTKNAGVTEDGDQTYYGRATSFEPHNNNPIVNMASHADIHTSWGRDIVDVTRDFGGLPDIGAVENHEANKVEEGENAYTDGQKAYGEGYFVRDYTSTGTQLDTYDKNNDGTYTKNDDGLGLYRETTAGSGVYALLDGSSWEYAINGNAIYATEERAETAFNTIFRSTPGGDAFAGTFTISAGGKYIYLDSNNAPKTTDDVTKAAHFEVENVTDGNMTTGSKYIRTVDTHHYLTGAGNAASSTTTLTRVNIENGYYIKVGNQYYVEKNGNIEMPKKGGAKTAWTFTADTHPTTGPEKAYKQDALTEVTSSTTGYTTTNVAQNAEVIEPMQFHVYHSLEDYQNSNAKVTFKIRGSKQSGGNNVHLVNKDSYFYPTPTWSAPGDDFILIQDGSYGKYYIYDVTAQKYMYYYTGAETGSRVRAGSDADKTTWWVDYNDANTHAQKLNIVYGGQPWTTTGNYAIQVTSNSNNAVSVGSKSLDNAPVSLISNQAYTAIKYSEVAVSSESHNGLQYAVNSASKAFMANPEHTTNPEKVMKQVWVGAGVYTSDPEDTAAGEDNAANNQGNCYVIQDGVAVFGAFPKNGNPGMEQREALVSQYVHVQPERGIANVADFETILQPKTQTLTIGKMRRVLGQPRTYNPKYNKQRGTNNNYLGASWDGFTLRFGHFDAGLLGHISDKTTDYVSYAGREGGAGACFYKNVKLQNMVITNNTCFESNEYAKTDNDQGIRAGGAYMDQGTLVSSYLINNKMIVVDNNGAPMSSGYDSHTVCYGGGMYLYSGLMYNCISAHNYVNAAVADGAGLFLEKATFFNNTVVNNTAEGGSRRKSGGITVYNSSGNSTLNLYNTIVFNNVGHNGTTGNNNIAKTSGTINCHNTLSSTTTTANNINYDSTCDIPESMASLFVNPGTVYTDNFAECDYRLKSTAAKAINKGNDMPTDFDLILNKEVTYDLSEYNDMDFAERIQDCRIDIGAYEFNGATAIAPQMLKADGKTVASTMDEAKQLVFYVTHMGYGSTNANDPANAACASKLQRVLDAAGRYKYLNPGKQVIVKVANDYDMLHAAEPENFTYYATRTTDWTDQDVRVWSIIVPRGVEVWGGYTDVALNDDGTEYKENSKRVWNNEHNGFVKADGTDRRNITKNPTYFDSYYLNKLEKTNANTYHVVTFTDRIFDINGYAYTKGDLAEKDDAAIKAMLSTGAASKYVELLDNDDSHFLLMSQAIDRVSTGVAGNVINIGTAEAPVYASNRAVIDGIFVSGGKADASTQSTNTAVNINSYGGAALVNDFAYVRNCILTGNMATYGGALALTDNALVSGCLIMDNEATNNGGGIYVFEDGTKLNNGKTVNTTAPKGQPMDYNMAHVLTSTIVQNKAQQGGGIWYDDKIANARFNSVAVWQNHAGEQANVYGMINPEQPTDDETISEIFYPFCYSAIESVRASGTNNLNVGSINHQGMRFVDVAHDVQSGALDQYDMAEEGAEGDAKYAKFGYYGLTTYSLLCSNGMPKTMYNQLKAAIAIADKDILSTDRLPQDESNLFVEIGARALEMQMPKKQLMLRLFVADPKYVDTETAGKFMRLTGGTGTAAEYYSQVGSSFAYPFNSLQNALDYIKLARNNQLDISGGSADAQNLPFEILVGRGEYYPKQSLNAETQNIWAATFAIPEGVTIIGGFNPKGGSGTYYGRYYKPIATVDGSTLGSIYNNVEAIPNNTVSPGDKEIGHGNKYGEEKVTPVGGSEITFQQWNIQDIADRRAMNDNNKNGIIEPWEFANQTIISGNSVNGETDGVYHVMTAVADANAVGNMPKIQRTYKDATGIDFKANETGYQWHEEGQQIRLNGLIVTGGNALTYLSTALDSYGSYIFYQGAGLQVDGNRYNTTVGGTPVFHNSAAYGVGYRDIPVSVTNCQFRNNKAGYGGAISTNGSLSLFGSSFEQNLAIANTEKPGQGETWTDINGHSIAEVNYPGQGGAILATRQLSAFNTLFANNEARYDDKYYAATAPTAKADLFSHKSFRVPSGAAGTLRAAGGAIMMGSAAEHHIVNCDFVRNKANMYPAVFTMNPTKQQNETVDTHDYSQIINTVAWGNEVNKISSDANYLRASKLMVNIGKKTRTQGYITDKNKTDFYDPSFAAANVPSDADLSNNNAEGTTWQEAVWFCAYEDGVGFKPNNTNDLRDAITYSAGRFAPTMIKEANNSTYQNCNLQIVAENGDVAGPNFGNPSMKAGFDGFMEGADWSPSRFNRLTDNGNGWITQSVDDGTLDVTFPAATIDSDKNPTNFQGAYPYTHYISDIAGKFPEYKLWLAIGNEKYMQATNDKEKTEKTINGTSIGTPQKNLPRISPDPTIGVTKAYIDIGVYEYIKQPLLKPGSEVDILWVSTKEHPENGAADGATWKTPTSDLQRAIETLLSSRNGHKKEIRIMEGEYAPVQPKTVGTTKYNAFVIDTKSLNAGAITPNTFEDGKNNAQYYAQSLTIKGGYSSEIPYEYNPVEYKTTIRQEEASTGISTDYLIYVADPTVRYAGTTGTTKDGAIVSGATTGADAASVKTMPIQVDGVTLINDKASANVKGSAIYYPDYTETAPEAGVNGAHTVAVGGTVVYYTSEEEMKKVDANGKHIGTTSSKETEFALIDDTDATTISDTKLLITKTMVIGSGKKDDTGSDASAVYIGQKGGAALIYNTVFHSNYGMPLDAYNTINVNNTFGKNTGMVRLQNAGGVTYVQSQMHNSALWKNNETSTKDVYGAQVLFGTAVPALTNALFTYNSFTGCTETTDGTSGNNYNTALVNDNSNIGEGPNFVDPENADIFARNFDLKPSIRLLNKGNDESITSGSGKYYTLVVQNKYDFALASTTDKDVLNRDRLKATKIDIGAYEFQGSLNSILYVDPNKSHNDDATGANWDEAFGYGDLQDAVDLASISHATNKTKESYVFVKGNSSTNTGQNTNETLTIRDGVTVYGSIGSDYTDWHDIKQADGTTPKYVKTDGEGNPVSDGHGGYEYDINKYIADMKSQREGVASNAASKTIVTGIKTSDGEYNGTTNNTPALVDGFVVTDPNSPKTPVLDVTNTSSNAVIVIRNVVVADNDLSSATDANVNVAQISNGLIYEALFRDNKPKGEGAVLKVSNYTNTVANPNYTTKGYAVNVTVEGKTVGADGTQPVDGKSAADVNDNVESATQIFKSVTNSINSGEGKNAAGAAAPYGQITNKGISGYFYNIADPNLNYQLTETSSYIDMCEAENPLTGIADNLASFINYTTDRDILGNPRLLTGVTDAGKIDRGAFETWKVENDFVCGKWTVGDKTYGTNQSSTIAAQFYPHDGSVVYVMENKSLVIDPLHDGEQIKPTPENPGYLLVKEGGSFYGNGRPVTAAYVAIERTVPQTGAIVSVPYGMKYKTSTGDISVVGTDGRDLQLTAHTAQQLARYNGNSRSDWKYIFQDNQSPCWDPIAANAVTPASEGVFFLPEHGTSGTLTYRFTGKGTSLTDYIYTETTDASKSIVLTKNDDAESTGDGADYTKDENMSWNCFGLPYLVSNYKPYEKATAYDAADKYMMNVPHTLWLYFDGIHTPDTSNETEKFANGDGGYYSVKSWSSVVADWHVANEAEKAIWVGEGIFTQTATLNDTESLVFYRPVAPKEFQSSQSKRYYVDLTNGVNTAELSGDAELIATEYYTVGGVRINKAERGSVTVVRKIYSNGVVKTQKMYVK